MKYINIAARNLNRQKKRSLLLCGAIAFGILIITLVNAFLAGMTTNIKEGIVEFLGGNVFISEQRRRDDGEIIPEFRDEDTILNILSDLGYTKNDVVKRSSMFATVIFNGRKSGQLVAGVNWDREIELQERIGLAEGSLEFIVSDPYAIVLSGEAAERLGVNIGEEVTLQASTVTGQENVGSFIVQGIMTGSGFLSSFSSYAHIKRVNTMINIGEDSYQNLHLRLPALNMTEGVSNIIQEKLSDEQRLLPEVEETLSASFAFSGGQRVFDDFTEDEADLSIWESGLYEVTDVIEFTTQIDQLINTVNAASLVFLLILIVIITVGVANTFRMVMLERVKEIGTMRAVGVQRGGIRRIFLWEAFGLGTVGYIVGVILAPVLSLFLKLITIPTDNPLSLFTLNGKFTFPFNLTSLIFNYFLVVIFTVLAANSPANRAAKLSPADALRS
ncbi:MAG: ABC transporter permease [Salinispira sp.]